MDEDSVCRCEIVGFGEIRASTIGASEHDEWYNVSINYKDGEGLFFFFFFFFFYTLFTYKEAPSSFRSTILSNKTKPKKKKKTKKKKNSERNHFNRLLRLKV